MKSTRIYLGLAGVLLVAALLAGCGGYGGGMTGGGGGSHGSRFLYAVNSDDATVSGFTINAATGSLTPVGPAIATGFVPVYAAATSDGKFLYVANDDVASNSVSAYSINPVTGALAPTTPAEFATTGDTQPLGIAVDPASKHVYTANVSSISAFNIDPVSGALSDVPGTPVLLPGTPEDVRVSPDGQFLYVTTDDGVVRFTFNAAGLPVGGVGPIPAGNSPAGLTVASNGKFLYVANINSNDVSGYTITPGTGVLVSTGATTSVGAGCAPQELTVDPASQLLFVSCSNAGVDGIAQFAINPASGALTPTAPAFATGANTTPRGMAVDASGKFLYTALSSANKASTLAIGANGSLTPSAVMPRPTGQDVIGVAVSGLQ